MADRTPEWAYSLMAFGLRTVGRASDCVRLGYERGFDSGEMMDAIYQDRASGRVLVGRLFDRLYLDQPGCRGLRGRKELLKSTLRGVLAEQRAAGRRPLIVDVAAGPATYLAELLAEPDQSEVIAIARDLDEHGLARGRSLAAEHGIDEARLRYVRADALDPETFGADERPTIAIASGFYEILLDDGLIRRSMATIWSVLADDGRFVFTTQVAHPQVRMMAHVPNRQGEPWIIRNRPLSVTEGYARDAGFTIISSSLEPTGIFGVTLAR
jgi:SAM-dependent methyltransferase